MSTCQSATVEEFYIKTIVGSEPAENKEITVYLFNSNKSLAIPLTLDKPTTDAVLMSYQSVLQKRPTVHDTLDKIIKGMGGKIIDLYVYMLSGGIYYCTLRLFVNGRSIEVEIKFSDGLCTAIKSRCPVTFEESVLKQIALNLLPH